MKHYLVNLIVVSLLMLGLTPSIVTAAHQEGTYGHQLMHGDWGNWHWGFGFGHTGFGILFWLVVVLTLVAIVALIRSWSQK